MTNEEMILKSVQAHLTPAQRHEIAAAAYTPEQIAHAVEHIPDGLDALVASQVHTFAWWKDNGKSVKRGEKALFTCPLWKYTDKPSKAQIKAAEAAGKEVQPAAHYYPTTSYIIRCGSTIHPSARCTSSAQMMVNTDFCTTALSGKPVQLRRLKLTTCTAVPPAAPPLPIWKNFLTTCPSGHTFPDNIPSPGSMSFRHRPGELCFYGTAAR